MRDRVARESGDVRGDRSDAWDGPAKDGTPESGDCTRDIGMAPRRGSRRGVRVAIAGETARGRPSGTADSSGCGPYHLFLLVPMLGVAEGQTLPCPRIDDLLLSVKETKVPCGSRVERNGRFIGEPRRLHVHLRKPLDPRAIPWPRPIES
jgi:hypothetical protein